jgi:hypothetical protein
MRFTTKAVSLALTLLVWASQSPAADGDDVLIRYHYAGVEGVKSNTELRPLHAVLALPESRRLLSETSRKLALNLPAWFGETPGDAGAEIAALEGVMRSLLKSESYLEVRGEPTRVTAWALAARLDNASADTLNRELGKLLARVLDVGSPEPDAKAWDLSSASSGRRGARFALQNGWTLLGSGAAVFDSFRQRIQDGNPPGETRSNSIFEVRADLDRLARWLRWPAQPPWAAPEWPRAHATIEPQGNSLRTRADFDFSQPLLIGTEAWAMPTDVLREPLVGFTAIRGAERWLKRVKLLDGLGIEDFPDQLFLWSLAGPMWQQYFAGPVPNPTNLLQAAGPLALRAITNSTWEGLNFRLRYTNNATRVEMHGLPYFAPFLQALDEDGRDMVFGGLFLPHTTGSAAPADLLGQVEGRTNLVFYDWETHWVTVSTNPPARRSPRLETNYWGRLQQWMDLSQVALSMTTPASEIPRTPSGRIAVPGLDWALSAIPHLGNTITEVSQSSPTRLSMIRRSNIGFSSFELVQLLRWLENPGFPGWREPTPPPTTSRGRGSPVSPPKRD